MPQQIAEPGLYYDFPEDDYYADPAPEPSFSQSIGKMILRSALHARQQHPRLAVKMAGAAEEAEEDEAEKYDKAKAIGNAAHAMLLRRGKKMAVGNFKGWRSKDAKEFKADALLHGREPILHKHNLIAHQMTLAAQLQLAGIPECERAFKMVEGSAEVVAVAKIDGIWIRTLLDFVTNDLREVWDYKTSGMSAAPWGIGRVMNDAGWHFQAATHDLVLNAIDPEGAGRRRYFYVMQEQDEPFALTVAEIAGGAMTIGGKQLSYALDKWRECLSTNQWPGYPQKIIRPELPGWAENAWIEREEREWDEREHRKLPKVRSPMLTDLSGG